MGRRRSKKKNKTQGTPTERVPLADMRKLERFLDVFPRLEEALLEIDDLWKRHIEYLAEQYGDIAGSDIDDAIQMAIDLVDMVGNQGHFEKFIKKPVPKPSWSSGSSSTTVSHSSNRNHQSKKEKKKKPQVCEIALGDVTGEEMEDGEKVLKID